MDTLTLKPTAQSTITRTAAADNPDTTRTLYAYWKANSQPTSSSSRDYGASVRLQETAEPTPTPEATAEPTPAQPAASPVNQPPQQTSTPVPVAGIIAGLGAAGLLFGLRRK